MFINARLDKSTTTFLGVKKIKTKIIKYSVALLAIAFALALPTLCNYSVAPVEESFDLSRFLGFNVSDLSSSGNPKISGYYNLTGSQIFIDDSDPNYNWSKTAAENDWCSGAGTVEDPYIVENVYIDGHLSIVEIPGKPYSANCLSIYESTAYFIVRGCFFTRAGTGEFNSGIFLRHTENGILYNNTLVSNGNNIFVGFSSHNTTVLFNGMYHNKSLYGPGRACLVELSDDVLVTRNYFENTDTGIQLVNSKYTEVRQNLLNSTYYGFPISVGINLIFINDSKITYNVFAGDYTGTNFDVLQSTSSGNVIENNTISGTIPNLGTPTPHLSGDYTDLIKLANSYSNTVSHNIAYIPGYVSSGIPGYDLFVVFGAIGIISTILAVITIKRKSKKF